MMRTILRLGVPALLVVASFSAAVLAQAQGPDTLVVAQGVDMQTGDPHKTTLTHAVNVLVNFYDTLIARDANLALKPGLAQSWRAVDPTTWEFKLRQGVKFHNGEPFNAQAVKFSFDRMLDPKTKWPGAAALRLVKSVSVVDDATVRIATERPWPLLPRYLGYYGPFVVDEAKGIVTHIVDGSSNPSWVGSRQVRYYALSADNAQLTLSLRDASGRTTQSLVWKRSR